MKIHEKYIRRCIQIGENGLGATAPNPMVGCVIVEGDKIIGEGFTSPYGGSHAEVNAIESVTDKSKLRQATLYVTLEPCSHFGKTPPCVDLILEHQIPNVVIGIQDPHDKVAGKGIAKLKTSGCEVVVGVLEDECREHHKRFLSYQEKQRPYIILKWAETSDGFVAPLTSIRNEKPEPYWITSENSRQLVHQWRAQEQAILVGTRTVLEDNPKLTVRDWEGANPIRVVLDRSLTIPKEYAILDNSAKTIMITEIKDTTQYTEGIIYEVADFGEQLIEQACTILYRHSISSIIIEGGAKTLQAFIDVGLWDEARIFTGPTVFGNGLKAPQIKGTPKHKRTLFSDTLTLLTHD